MAVAGPPMLWRPADDPLAGKRVRYLVDDAERRSYELEVAAGGGFLWGGRPLTPEDVAAFRVPCNAFGEEEEGAIFVMGGDGAIYMANQAAEITETLHFHHTSFLAGGRAAAAGVLRFRAADGFVCLAEISDLSGHYQPDARHTWQLVVELERRGVPLDGVWVTGWHFTVPAEARFLLENPTLFELSRGD